MLATLYIRFENGENGGIERATIGSSSSCPVYVVYAGIVYWYLPSLYRQVALRLVAGFAEHHPRRDGAGGFAAGPRLHPSLSDALRHLSSSARSRLRSTGCCRCSSSAVRALPIVCSGIRAPSSTSRRSDAVPTLDRRARGGRRGSDCGRSRAVRSRKYAGRNPVAVFGRSGPACAAFRPRLARTISKQRRRVAARKDIRVGRLVLTPSALRRSSIRKRC